MPANNRNRSQNATGGSLAAAAVGVLVGLAAVEHVHAREENRESIVDGLFRWVREDILEIPSSSRRGRAQRGYSARGRVLTRTDIEALPVRVLTDEMATEGSADLPNDEKSFCAICQEQFGKGDHLMRLPCFHEYHEGCIRGYLESADNPICPICRHPVTV